MKKAFPSNINGKIYYIDEDAYNLLQDYLTQLRAAFPGAEGAEIVEDIEARIGELLDEKTSHGIEVVNIEFVNGVIERMGRPADITGEVAEEDIPLSSGEDAENGGGQSGEVPPPPYVEPPVVEKRLYRDPRNKVFFGVISGLGHYLGWDVTVLRILVIILAFSTAVIPCIVIYLIAAAVIPPAVTPRQILEMQGQPVTIENVGQTVIDNTVQAEQNSASLWTTIFSAIGKVVLATIGFFCALIAISFAIAAIALLLVNIGNDFFVDTPFGDEFGGFGQTTMIGILCGMAAAVIPFGAVAWVAIKVLLGSNTYNKWIVLGGVIVEIALIAAACVLTAIDHTTCFAFCSSGITAGLTLS